MRGGSETAWLSYGVALLAVGLGAYGAGSLLRLGRGDLTLLGMCGFAVLVAVLLSVMALTDRLASAQARQQLERALGQLDDRYRVFGRVRLRVAGSGAAVADYVVIGPGERLWPLVLDRTAHGAWRARAAALAGARRTGALLERAAQEGGLPGALGVSEAARAEPIVVALRRRVPGAVREDGVCVGNPEHVAAWLDGAPAACEDRA